MPSRMMIDRLRGNDGMVLPATMWVLFAMLLFGASAASSAIVSSSETRLDQKTKRAIAAADAAVELAVARLNTRHVPNGSCPTVTTDQAGQASVRVDQIAEGTAPAADGTVWCPVSPTETQENGTTVQYRISSGSGTNSGGCNSSTAARKVVGVGSADGRTRAITTSLATLGGPLFPCATVSLKPLTMQDYGKIVGDVASNGSISVLEQSTVCGKVDVAGWTAHQGWITCGGTATITPSEAPYAKETIATPALAAMDNFRITNAKGNCGGCAKDDIVGNPADVTWDPGTRELVLKNNVQLNLRGTQYDFCDLKIQDYAQLSIAAGHKVRIYMDSQRVNAGPSQTCANKQQPVSVVGHGMIKNNNVDATTGKTLPSTFAIIGLGTDRSQPGQNDCSTAPTMRFRDDNDPEDVTVMPVLIYAPAWCVRISGGVAIDGSVVATQLVISKHGELDWNDDALNYTNPIEASYVRVNNWRNCKPVNPANFDDSGCASAPHP